MLSNKWLAMDQDSLTRVVAAAIEQCGPAYQWLVRFEKQDRDAEAFIKWLLNRGPSSNIKHSAQLYLLTLANTSAWYWSNRVGLPNKLGSILLDGNTPPHCSYPTVTPQMLERCARIGQWPTSIQDSPSIEFERGADLAWCYAWMRDKAGVAELCKETPDVKINQQVKNQIFAGLSAAWKLVGDKLLPKKKCLFRFLLNVGTLFKTNDWTPSLDADLSTLSLAQLQALSQIEARNAFTALGRREKIPRVKPKSGDCQREWISSLVNATGQQLGFECGRLISNTLITNTELPKVVRAAIVTRGDAEKALLYEEGDVFGHYTNISLSSFWINPDFWPNYEDGVEYLNSQWRSKLSQLMI